jgi:hypothetical protein
MRNTGVRNPGRSALICLAIVAAGALSIWSGIAEMNDAGHETTGSGLKIGVGMAVVAIAAIMLCNFLVGIRALRRVRLRRGEIAHWTVTTSELDAFRINDQARSALGAAYRNDYRVPEKTAPGGTEVVFLEDGVSVGGTYFSLTTTGLYRFVGVQMLPQNPLAIEFGTVLTWISSGGSSTRVDQFTSVLRIPVARLGRDAAAKALEHFRKVDARQLIVNPGFYRGRIRAGLIGTPVLFAIAAAGFGLNAIGVDLGIIPLCMAVIGTVAGLGALCLAGAAAVLSRLQHSPR